ncbi:MAG: PaaI family thioesterase [Desulfobacterales bacterium]|nr:PaaI family thioesterase [Desulfobacterales bacterium]
MKTENRDEYILLPNGGNHNCFGCSPRNRSGLQMKFYSTERRQAVVSWLTIPDHLCGWSNLVHGGIISTILDEAMGWAAVVILKKLVVSKSITVDFIKPVLIGKEIRVEGNVGKINSEREAVLQGCIYNDNGEICARSSSLFSLFSLESIKKMGFVDQDMLGDMEQVMNMRLGRED